MELGGRQVSLEITLPPPGDKCSNTIIVVDIELNFLITIKNPESINILLSTDKLKVIPTWEKYASPSYLDIIFDCKGYEGLSQIVVIID